MKLNLRYGALAPLACLLAACGSNSGGDKGTATGHNQVLKGTISDDMIAYDTLKSQPPAAQVTTTSSEPSATQTAQPKNEEKAPEADSSSTSATPTVSAPAAPAPGE